MSNEFLSGDDVRQMRLAAGLTQKQAAEKAQVAKRTWERWESAALLTGRWIVIIREVLK